MSDHGQRKNAVTGGKPVAAVATGPAEIVAAAAVEAVIVDGTHGTHGTYGTYGTHGDCPTAGDAGPREDVDDGRMPRSSSSYVTRKLTLPLPRPGSEPDRSEAHPFSSDAGGEDAEFAALRLTFSSPAVFPAADSDDSDDSDSGDGDSGDGDMWAAGITSGSAHQDDDDGRDGSAEVGDAALVGQLRAGLRQAQDELAAQRRRSEYERGDLTRFAKSEMIVEILPVLDDLERASVQVPARLRDDPWVMGVLLIGHGVRALLERQGVERIAPWQGLFDPRLHEAVSRVHDPAVPVNTVTDVYRPGYALHGRVLRPAQVQVAVTQPVEREEDR